MERLKIGNEYSHYTSGIKLIEGALYASGSNSGGSESFHLIQEYSAHLSPLFDLSIENLTQACPNT